MTTRITNCNVATADVETINGDRGSWYILSLRDPNGKTIAEVSIFGASEVAGDNLAAVKWTFDRERLNFPAPTRQCCEFHSTGGSRRFSCGGDNAVDYARRIARAADAADAAFAAEQGD